MLKPKRKAVDAHIFTKRVKIFLNSVCQKAYGNCFQGQEKGPEDGIHATRGHNKVRSVL
jgi:hypothetical protein